MSSAIGPAGFPPLSQFSGYTYPAYGSAPMPRSTPAGYTISDAPAAFMPIPASLQPLTLQSPRPPENRHKRPFSHITAAPDAGPPCTSAPGTTADTIKKLRAKLQTMSEQYKAQSATAANTVETLRGELAAACKDIATLREKLRKKTKMSDEAIGTQDDAIAKVKQEVARMRADVDALRRERRVLATERRSHKLTLAGMKNELTGYKDVTTRMVEAQDAQIAVAVQHAKKACEQADFNQQGVLFNTGVTAQCVRAVEVLRQGVDRTNAQLGYTDIYLDLTDDSKDGAEQKESTQQPPVDVL